MNKAIAHTKILIINFGINSDEEFISILSELDYTITGYASSVKDARTKALIYNPHLIVGFGKVANKEFLLNSFKDLNKNISFPMIYFSENELYEEFSTLSHDGLYISNITDEINQIKQVIDGSLENYQDNIQEKMLRKDLYDKSKLLDSIVKFSRDGIFFVEPDLTISMWNPSCEQIFIYSMEEAIGEKIHNLIIPKQYRKEFKDAFELINSGMSSQLFDRNLQIFGMKKGGELFPCELKLSVARLQGQYKVCGYARDISERVIYDQEITKLIEELQITKDITEQNANDLLELNQKLVESETQLKELNSSKDRFFSILSHDLKGPFQTLIGYSDILAHDIDTLTTEEIKEFSSSTYETARNLFRLLENLLHWARIQRGAIKYTPDNFDIKLLAEQNLSIQIPRAKEKGVVLENNIKETFMIYGDVNMIDTVLRNLLSNSIKFTKGGDTISLGIEQHDEEFMRIYIADTGIGMSKEIQDKLFKVGEKVTTKGTNDEAGTGLGLVLCKDLVEKNGGKIWVESEIGQGAKFYFTISKAKVFDEDN